LQKLSAEKKAGYKQYWAAQNEIRELVTVKANIDHLLRLTDVQKNKEMER
jgi:hypothetical protein